MKKLSSAQDGLLRERGALLLKVKQARAKRLQRQNSLPRSGGGSWSRDWGGGGGAKGARRFRASFLSRSFSTSIQRHDRLYHRS